MYTAQKTFVKNFFCGKDSFFKTDFFKNFTVGKNFLAFFNKSSLISVP